MGGIDIFDCHPSALIHSPAVLEMKRFTRQYVYKIKNNWKQMESKSMIVNEEQKVPWYLWPFWALWRLVATIVGITGRLVAVILGFVLMLVGVILTVTLIGMIIGVPLIILGFLLVLRGLF
jgi:hypothetical protein